MNEFFDIPWQFYQLFTLSLFSFAGYAIEGIQTFGVALIDVIFKNDVVSAVYNNLKILVYPIALLCTVGAVTAQLFNFGSKNLDILKTIKKISQTGLLLIIIPFITFAAIDFTSVVAKNTDSILSGTTNPNRNFTTLLANTMFMKNEDVAPGYEIQGEIIKNEAQLKDYDYLRATDPDGKNIIILPNPIFATFVLFGVWIICLFAGVQLVINCISLSWHYMIQPLVIAMRITNFGDKIFKEYLVSFGSGAAGIVVQIIFLKLPFMLYWIYYNAVNQISDNAASYTFLNMILLIGACISTISGPSIIQKLTAGYDVGVESSMNSYFGMQMMQKAYGNVKNAVSASYAQGNEMFGMVAEYRNDDKDPKDGDIINNLDDKDNINSSDNINNSDINGINQSEQSELQMNDSINENDNVNTNDSDTGSFQIKEDQVPEFDNNLNQNIANDRESIGNNLSDKNSLNNSLSNKNLANNNFDNKNIIKNNGNLHKHNQSKSIPKVKVNDKKFKGKNTKFKGKNEK